MNKLNESINNNNWIDVNSQEYIENQSKIADEAYEQEIFDFLEEREF